MRNSNACPDGIGSVGDPQRFIVGDAELLPNEVEPGGLFADRVLDLQPGVHLEEADRAIQTDQVLDRAGAAVAGLAADRLGRFVDLGALGVGQERGRGLFDQLLMAALQRAVAGADDDHVAVVVGQHLRLDVARLIEIALDEALAAPERGDRLAGGTGEQLGDLLDRAGHLQPAPAPAERRLDRDRQPVRVGELHDLVGVLGRLRRSRHQRRPSPGRDVPGGHLVTQITDRLRRRPDPGQPGIEHRLREVGVLRQEPVPRMHRIRPRLAAAASMILSIRKYESAGVSPPSAYASSAIRTCRASRSGSAYTATDRYPASRHARITRTAISPRFAISTFCTSVGLPVRSRRSVWAQITGRPSGGLAGRPSGARVASRGPARAGGSR